MKSFLALAVGFLLLAAPVAAAESLLKTPRTEKLVVASAGGARHVFHVELALDAPTRALGLMHRTELPADGGMLFIFPEDMDLRFWMKDTLIPLDILFIRADGYIHHIHPNAVPKDLTPIPSWGLVRAALELNGGTAEKLGIRPGDTVYSKRFFGNEIAD